jgi:hypothetical protein
LHDGQDGQAVVVTGRDGNLRDSVGEDLAVHGAGGFLEFGQGRVLVEFSDLGSVRFLVELV